MATEDKARRAIQPRRADTIKTVLERAASEKRRAFLAAGDGTNDPAMDAEDMVQVASLEAWKNRDKINGVGDGGNPESVLYGLVGKRTADARRRSNIRRRKGHGNSLEEAMEFQGDDDKISVHNQESPDFTANLQALEIIDALKDALSKIGAIPLDVYILQGSIQGKGYAEIAEELNGLNKFTWADGSEKPFNQDYVKQRLLQIRRKLIKTPIMQQLRQDYNLSDKKKKKA